MEIKKDNIRYVLTLMKNNINSKKDEKD